MLAMLIITISSIFRLHTGSFFQIKCALEVLICDNAGKVRLEFYLNKGLSVISICFLKLREIGSYSE
jgi:hypothetical protein